MPEWQDDARPLREKIAIALDDFAAQSRATSGEFKISATRTTPASTNGQCDLGWWLSDIEMERIKTAMAEMSIRPSQPLTAKSPAPVGEDVVKRVAEIFANRRLEPLGKRLDIHDAKVVWALPTPEDYVFARAAIAAMPPSPSLLPAFAVIGNLQRLVVNVLYWIEHGQSETAAKALNLAMADDWAQVGWRDICDRERPPDRYGEGHRAGVIGRPFEIEVTAPEREALQIAREWLEALANRGPPGLALQVSVESVIARISTLLGETASAGRAGTAALDVADSSGRA